MEKLIIHNVEQGSEEWFELKLFALSGSKAQEIGNQGKGLDTLTTELADNAYCGFREEGGYLGYDMERGNRLEPTARYAYELQTGLVVKEVGCGTRGKYICCSPDGLVGSTGGIEIKARKRSIHSQLLRTGKVDSKTIWQMNMNMLVFDRLWWDFVSYNKDFRDKSLFIKRFTPDADMFRRLKRGFQLGEQQIKSKLIQLQR